MSIQSNLRRTRLSARAFLFMGYIRGEGRSQGTLFPVVLDDLIAADHVCRVIDAFVDCLSIAELGFDIRLPKGPALFRQARSVWVESLPQKNDHNLPAGVTGVPSPRARLDGSFVLLAKTMNPTNSKIIPGELCASPAKNSDCLGTNLNSDCSVRPDGSGK